MVDRLSTAGRHVPEVLERRAGGWIPPAGPPLAPRTTPDERPARQTLRAQIARLEEELAGLFCSTWPRHGFDFGVPASGGPRVLTLAELEQTRDRLSERVSQARRALSERTYVEEQNRCLIEEMLLEPERHKWIRVANEDIGEPGCKHWHVRPRWGILGMLLNWWRVRISSGCPLAI
jgi:hypothetical protein